MGAEGRHRPAWVEIDLGAVRENAATLARIAAPANLCAVVKADAYGHSAVPAAKAALEGGASELAVALVDEGVELREAGIEAPILVLSEPGLEAMEGAFSSRLTLTLYTRAGVRAAREAARRVLRAAPRAGAGTGGTGGTGGTRNGAALPFGVEVKLDTGMHRVGAAPGELAEIVGEVVASPELSYRGLWTHLAVAEVLSDPFTGEQLARLESARAALAATGLPPAWRVHAANSAGAIAWPAARYDLVRCGIALYGHLPGPELEPVLARELARVGRRPLAPVMSLKARVTMVREYEAGERLSYGLVEPLKERSLVATVPVGYADGVDRGYFPGGGEVLIGGRRCPLAGTVTMDQILVRCAPESGIEAGDEVVLIGRQRGEEITAEEWARRLGTVTYEIVARIGGRVPRVQLDRAAEPAAS